MILVGIKYKIVKYLMKRGEIDMNINEEFKLEMLEAKDKEVIDSINSYFRENEIRNETGIHVDYISMMAVFYKILFNGHYMDV